MVWTKKDLDADVVRSTAKQYGCSPLVASILLRRGIAEGRDILFYLENDLRYVHNPFLFKDMEDAVDRILDAKEEGERVLIFGDRDVDGITAVTILYEALIDIGIDTAWRIPTGDDPYGLTCDVVDEHAENNGTLIITVDCGISNIEEIQYAGTKGIDVIVIDHHTPQETIPAAAVIINPKMKGCGYPNEHLSGCAVAWKVINALRFSFLDIYKQEICLLNVRPANEVFTVEALRMVNMVETKRISETLVPGLVSFTDTRLGPFLEGQQIIVWDKDLQLKQLHKLFDDSIQFNVLDLQSLCTQLMPQCATMSLLRLKQFSTIGKYLNQPLSELDVFFNLFTTFIQQTHHVYGEKDRYALQLVALSLLADLMPLQDENRILVKRGLSEINDKPRSGLVELMAKQSLIEKHIGTADIAWNISPLINATGRMGKPETAIKLFLSKNPEERYALANAIVKMNTERKQLGQTGWLIAEPLAYESLELYQQKLTVVVSDKIHRGITGILANRLAAAFNVPSIVICVMDNGTAVASLRSAREYRVLSILEAYADLFLDYGGHTFAAGCSLLQENIELFLEKLRHYAGTMEFAEGTETQALTIDAELPHEYLTPDLLSILDMFEPYGEQFPLLLFSAKKMKITAANIMGKTTPQHLKLTLACGQHLWSAVYWQAAERLHTDFDIGDTIDAVFTISRNTFNKNTIPQMIIQDIKKT